MLKMKMILYKVCTHKGASDKDLLLELVPPKSHPRHHAEDYSQGLLTVLLTQHVGTGHDDSPPWFLIG